jgi:predicted XRE-type DNA-binding protein
MGMSIQTMIDDLLGAGLTQTEIASAIGCQQSYVSKLHRGVVSRVAFDIGTQLTALHKRHRRRIKGRVLGNGRGDRPG